MIEYLNAPDAFISAAETTTGLRAVTSEKSSSTNVVKEVPAAGAKKNASVDGAALAGVVPNIEATRETIAPTTRPLLEVKFLDIDFFLSWFLDFLLKAKLKTWLAPTKQEQTHLFTHRVAEREVNLLRSVALFSI